jgi:hypothetical protein
MAINTIGPKKKYKYTTDAGVVIKLRLDATYGDLPEAGLEELTTADEAQFKPDYFSPRVVFWQSDAEQDDGQGGTTTAAVRRRQIVCAADSTLYTSVDQQNLTIDGVSGYTTGRKGETQSF